jgi:hypothetical protein
LRSTHQTDGREGQHANERDDDEQDNREWEGHEHEDKDSEEPDARRSGWHVRTLDPPSGNQESDHRTDNRPEGAHNEYRQCRRDVTETSVGLRRQDGRPRDDGGQ